MSVCVCRDVVENHIYRKHNKYSRNNVGGVGGLFYRGIDSKYLRDLGPGGLVDNKFRDMSVLLVRPWADEKLIEDIIDYTNSHTFSQKQQ